ncbi:MAG TPA: rRNA maturation RNase YbeY [Bacteroidales bacterium]|nr:rRNA maturation RNase YbeY [Bacteroidales bacterium]
MRIRIFYDETVYRYKGWLKLKDLTGKILASEKRKPGEINFIITTDRKLKDINVEFLEHNYFTDVITFNYNTGNIVSGEIYISIDTVKDNAGIYETGLKKEMSRVMIHGILHLAGYDDKSDEEKQLMRKMEDFWLDKLGF